MMNSFLSADPVRNLPVERAAWNWGRGGGWTPGGKWEEKSRVRVMPSKPRNQEEAAVTVRRSTVEVPVLRSFSTKRSEESKEEPTPGKLAAARVKWPAAPGLVAGSAS